MPDAGGMLATWMRMKFPHIVDGVIAGSAPIWTFYGEVRARCDLASPSNGSLFCQSIRGLTHRAVPIRTLDAHRLSPMLSHQASGQQLKWQKHPSSSDGLARRMRACEV